MAPRINEGALLCDADLKEYRANSAEEEQRQTLL
jgi:hypothetical protein